MASAKKKYIARSISRCKQPVTSKGVLTTAVLAQLSHLFDEKKWSRNMAEESCFMRFGRTLAKLSLTEQFFLIELTKRFDYIHCGLYHDELRKPVGELLKHRVGKIIFVGCLSEEDVRSRSIKSCKEVLYRFKGTAMAIDFGLDNSIVFENVKKIPDSYIRALNSNEATLVFVDDFIGTGDTARKAIEYLCKVQPNLSNWKNICFLSIATLQEGLKNLKGNGFKVYTSRVYPKGISEYYRGEKLKESINQMTKIESQIKVPESLHFGYKQSEALVCMERCPNNTFPVYWRGKNDAPFVR